jgi:hypothetical protein
MSTKDLKVIYAIVMLVLASCSAQRRLPSQEGLTVDWEKLQITPMPDDELCTEILPEDLDYTGEEIKRDFSYGVMQGLFPEGIFRPYKIAGGTYWIDANAPLTLNWIFVYPAGNTGPLDLRIFVLRDEAQLTNALPQPGSYNDLHLEKGDTVTIKVKIPPLPAGVHEVHAVALPLPQNDPDEYGTVDVMSKRMTLIAEPASAPFRNIDFAYLPADGSIERGDPGLSIEVMLREDSLHIWNWPDPWLNVKAGTPNRFYALAGHEDVINVDAPSLPPLEKSFFALLFFIDYQQVEMAPGQSVLYGAVEKDNAYSRISVEIPPLPEGKHHLLVLRINTPGVPYCLLKADSLGRFLPFDTYGRLVGINVLPPP